MTYTLHTKSIVHTVLTKPLLNLTVLTSLVFHKVPKNLFLFQAFFAKTLLLTPSVAHTVLTSTTVEHTVLTFLLTVVLTYTALTSIEEA